jgi:hypothetical protein
VQGTVSAPRVAPDGATASWTIETWGPNWRVATDFHWFRWDDFVAADMAASDWRRFPLGLAALMEFILTGTAIRYFIVAWRYGGFFLYPLVYVLGMILAVDRGDAVRGRPWRPAIPHAARAGLCLAVFVVLRQTFGGGAYRLRAR